MGLPVQSLAVQGAVPCNFQTFWNRPIWKCVHYCTWQLRTRRIWIQPAVYQSLSRSRTLTIVWFSIAGGIYQVTEKGYVHHFVIFCMSLNQQMRALSSFQGLANNLKSVFKLVGSYDIKISVPGFLEPRLARSTRAVESTPQWKSEGEGLASY